MRVSLRRLRKLVFWSTLLLLAILAGGLGFAYTYVTDSATLAAAVREHAPLFLPGSEVSVTRVQVRPLLGEVAVHHAQVRQTIDGRPFTMLQLPWVNVRSDLWELAAGRFVPREVMVAQPTLTIRRRKDGTFNLQGLLADPWPGPPLEQEPSIIIRNGTVRIVDEDAREDDAAVLLRDVTLQIEPMPEGPMRFDGTAHGDLFGALHLEGTYDRASGRLTLTKGDLGRLTLSDTLRRRLPAEGRAKFDRAKLVGGELDVVLKRLVYDPKAAKPLSYQATAHLRGGRWSPPDLPFPLDDVEMVAACDGRVVTIAEATGRNGKTIVRASGSLSATDPSGGPMDLNITATDLELDGRLRAVTPPEFTPLWREFSPQGWINVGLHVVRSQAGAPPGFGLTVGVQDVGITYHLFPYPLEHVRGTLKWEGSTIAVDVRTLIGGEWVTATGTIDDPGPDAIVKLDFASRRLPIDETLFRALPPDIEDVVRQFHPSGHAGGTAELRRLPPERPGAADRVSVVVKGDVVGGAMKWDGMPLPVSDLVGRLEIYPDHWEFRDMVGRNGTAVIRGSGRVAALGPGRLKADLNLRAEDLAFNPDLRAALPKKWQDTWDTLKPSGTCGVAARIEVEPDGPPHYHINLIPGTDTRIRLGLTPVAGSPGVGPEGARRVQLPAMENISGTFAFDDELVTMRDVRFLFREAPVSFREGTVHLDDSGKFALNVADLEVAKLRLDASLREVMPPVMATFAQRLDDGRSFGVHTDMEIGWSGRAGEPARCSWKDATVVFDGNTIQTGLPMRDLQGQVEGVTGWSDGRGIELDGRVNLESVELLGIQLTRLTAAVGVHGDRATFSDIRGKVLGGDATGRAEITLAAVPSYSVEAHVVRADLAEYARTVHGHQDIRGFVNADVDVTGEGMSLRSLRGTGHAEMFEGNLGQLPWLLRLVKLPNRRPATKTAFDSANLGAVFKDGRAVLDPIVFRGDAFTLEGSGTVRLENDNELDLHLVPAYGRADRRIPFLSDAMREAGGEVFEIFVTGPIAAPQPRVVTLPRAAKIVRGLGRRRAEKD